MAQKAKQGKKQRKWGRNAAYRLRYKNSHRREQNKARKLRKHLIRFPNDLCAKKAVENCIKTIRGY